MIIQLLISAEPGSNSESLEDQDSEFEILRFLIITVKTVE
jgi:hypothetical protein